MTSTLTDLELIEAVDRGNMAAFRTLYYRHVDNIYGLVTRILGPERHDVEDTVQEVFIQAHRSLSRFQGQSKFSTWLHRVAVNVCYSHLRRRSASSLPMPQGEISEQEWGISESRVDARREVNRMYQLIDEMAPKARMVFTLHEFQGMTLAEIAETLDIPLYTAASRLRRARERLMQVFSETAYKSKGEEK